MQEPLPSYEDAESLRKTDPMKALEPFRRLWDETKQFRAARGYAFCLRRQGDVDGAIAVCNAALDLYPDNAFVRNELAWALYLKKIKPAREEGDLRAILSAAEEILSLNPDSLVQRKIGLKVMQVAKANQRWQVVLDWANRFKTDDFCQ
jgi:tetratricopeptide (TPR) repeat protein